MYFSLKTTTIILSWFQMFCLTAVSVLLPFVVSLLTKEHMDDVIKEQRQFTFYAFVFLVNWLIIIKTPALIALSWGAAKSKHSYYVPWLIAGAIEIIWQLVNIASYYDIYIASWIDIGRISSVLILNSIIFLCAYTVYKRDKARQETHYD